MEESLYATPSNKSLMAPMAERWCETIFHIIWAFFFYRALDGESQATCAEPVWFWGNYTYYYYCTAAICVAVGTILLPILFNFTSNRGILFYLLVMTFVRVTGLGVTVGMIISFFNRDVCPPLSTIVLIQFILVAIGIGVIVISLMCTCGLFLSALILASSNLAERRRSLASLWRTILGNVFLIMNYSSTNRSGYTNV